MDINFLDNKKNTKKPGRLKGKFKKNKQNIEWFKPEKKSEIILDEQKKTLPSLKKKSRFSFLRKKNDLNKFNDGGVDKNIIKNSRKEILKIIKEESKNSDKNKDFTPPIAKNSPVEKNDQDSNKSEIRKSEPPKPKKEIIKKVNKFFSKMFNQLRKKGKGVLVDYKKVLKKIKKRVEPVDNKITSEHKILDEIKKPEVKVESKEKVEIASSLVEENKEEEPRKKIKSVDESKKIFEKRENKEEKKIENNKTIGTDWVASNVLETNLIKGKAVIFFNWQKNVISLLIFSTVIVCLLGAIYLGLRLWDRSQIKTSNSLTIKINEINQDIKETEISLEEVLIFKEKLGFVTALLDQHIYWTNFFDFLEENTLIGVYYSNFSGDNKGSYNLTANTSDYSFIAAQVKQFLAQEKVIDASVDQAALLFDDKESGLNKVDFKLKLVVSPSIFIK